MPGVTKWILRFRNTDASRRLVPTTLISEPSGQPVPLESLLAAVPQGGLFADKEWLLSPYPLMLTRKFVKRLEMLGRELLKWQQVSDQLYQQSHRGKQPAFVAQMLDAGKPPELIEMARMKIFAGVMPRVLRPDLLVGEDSVAMSELDSLPGGIGLTAWLNQTYSSLGHNVLGGASAMLDGFDAINGGGADIYVSPEANAYLPEMEWLAGQLNARGPSHSTVTRYALRDTGHYVHRSERAYRFFELFDLPNLECAQALLADAAAGKLDLTPPPKPWLEEKLWMVLLWCRPLAGFWRRELGAKFFDDLLRLVPPSVPVDPQPLPPHALLPVVNAHCWEEVASFSKRERHLVLKPSGFSEMAWGSRGVVIGSDVSGEVWAEAVSKAAGHFATTPWLIQEFRETALVDHPYYDRDTGDIRTMRGRVRLCPYYFVIDGEAHLSGVLATICPADKKLIHGMTDAILCPCASDSQ